MGNLGFWEIALLAVLALLVFGPERLPGMARNLGRAVAKLRAEAQGTLDELKHAADLKELEELRSLKSEMKGIGKELMDVKGQLDPKAIVSSAGAGGPVNPAPFDADAT